MSPWPLLLSMNLMFVLMIFINCFNQFKVYLLFISMVNLNLILFQWWRDVVRESIFQGTWKVMNNLNE